MSRGQDPDRGDRAAPLVVAVVLSWNRCDHTLACLRSLAASNHSPLATLVVDNGSTDGTAAAVADQFPDTHLLALPDNRGYAGGMNAGIERVLALDADYALLLNNDVQVAPDMVGALVDAARAHPEAGIVQPLIRFADPPDRIWCAGLRFDPRRGYWGRPLGYGADDEGQFAGVREVDAASGCAMLVPAPILRAVGGFDEALFTYLEDVELSLRVRAAGHRVMVAGAAQLAHHVSASSGGEYSPAIAYYGARNRFVVTARHAPLRGPRAAVRHLEILLTNLVHARRGQRPLQNARAVLAGWRDYRAGRLGPRP
jgi:GT2 family glycosyltransferase